MAKFHISPATGDPKRCSATKRPCPYGGEEAHYGSAAEARQAYERIMGSLESPEISVSPLLTAEELRALPVDKQRAIVGGVWRLFPNESPGARSKEFWQAVYDSTEAGQLELERRKRPGPYDDEVNPEYATRQKAVEALRASGFLDTLPLELPELDDLEVPRDFSSREPLAFPERPLGPDPRKTFLALTSASWMAKLSPEEVEAVAWVTSNGASILNSHANGIEHKIWGYEVYPAAHLDKTIASFRSAMEKAPELDEAIVIYRGTSSERATLSKLSLPASSTLSGSRAKSFFGSYLENNEGHVPVLMEIKTAKVASVAAMGAWGASEHEVLAPLGAYRKVDEFDAIRGQEGSRFGGRAALDPELDTITVIQYEHLS